MSSGLCVLHHSKPAEATHGRACAHHHAMLRETLQDILEFWALLPLHIVPGSAVADGSKYQKKRPDPPAPLRLDIAAMRDPRTDDTEQRVSLETHGDRYESNGDENLLSVPGVLYGWAVIVREERGYDEAGTTVMESIDLLRRNLDWITDDDVLVPLEESLRDLRRQLASSHGERNPKPVGKCPSLDGDGIPCGGPLWPADGEMAVDCGKCKRHFDERFLRHLGGMMSVPPETIPA